MLLDGDSNPSCEIGVNMDGWLRLKTRPRFYGSKVLILIGTRKFSSEPSSTLISAGLPLPELISNGYKTLSIQYSTELFMMSAFRIRLLVDR